MTKTLTLQEFASLTGKQNFQAALELDIAAYNNTVPETKEVTTNSKGQLLIKHSTNVGWINLNDNLELERYYEWQELNENI